LPILVSEIGTHNEKKKESPQSLLLCGDYCKINHGENDKPLFIMNFDNIHLFFINL